MTEERVAAVERTEVWNERLRYEERSNLAVVRLVREPTGNLMDEGFFEAVEMAVAALQQSPHLRGVLWTSSGRRVFSLGADTRQFEGMTPSQALAFAQRWHRLGLALRDLPMPQVACLNGLAMGGGLELALWLDFRVMAEHTALALPEIKLGIMPAWGGVSNLARAVGHDRASELVLSGRRINAEEALAIGLVQAIASTDQLLERASELLRSVPPVPRAVTGIRRSLDAGAVAALAVEASAFAACFETPDAHEGLAAYREKRQPRFGL